MIRAIAPKAVLRPFHSRARSASSRAIRIVRAPCARPIALDLLDLHRQAVLRTGDLDQQDRRCVGRQPGVDVLLHRPGAQLIHHLQRRGDHSGGDDRRDGRRAVGDIGEVEQHRSHCRRILGQADADLGRDPEHPLRTDEHPAQVEPVRLRLLATEEGDTAVREDDLEPEDVRTGHPVGEAVWSSGVVRHVAADRARLLARRVGGEMEAVGGDRPGQVEVEHSRFDPRLPVDRIDGQDPVHLGRDDHDRCVERRRTSGQSRPRTASDERPSEVVGRQHAGANLGRRRREADHTRSAVDVGGVPAVQGELRCTDPDPLRGESPAELGEQLIVDRHARTVAAASGPTGRRRPRRAA